MSGAEEEDWDAWAREKLGGGRTELDLAEQGIDDEIARALGEALRTNGTLQTLHLGRNYIGDEGARALCEVLRTLAVNAGRCLRHACDGQNLAGEPPSTAGLSGAADERGVDATHDVVGGRGDRRVRRARSRSRR